MPRSVADNVGKFSQHYPKVAAIVTASARGRDNAMTVAWHSSISMKPPLYGVSLSPKRFTYQLICESEEFGINFLPLEKVSLSASLGGVSGQQTDKLELLGIEREQPVKTGAPILRDAYAAYECRLVDSKTYGDHIWVVGEIVAVHFLEEAFTPQETLDLNRVQPLLYMGSDLYASTDERSSTVVKRGIQNA